MKLQMALYFVLIQSLTSCGNSFDINDQSRIQRTVQPHPNHDGVYLVYYRYEEMIDRYGPGWNNTLRIVRSAKSNTEIYNIWDHALTLAVPRYLEERGLIPSKCTTGIIVIRNSMNEGGGGTTAFRCKGSE